MTQSENTSRFVNGREVEHDIDPIFPMRWSRRAMSGEIITKKELYRIFEAARWAPSSNNNQPWRFVYCLRNSTEFSKFLDLLVPGNQIWAKYAAALIIVASLRVFERNGKPSRSHSFDCGAAWGNMALQGVHMGLVIHAMEGFSYERAYEVAQIPTERYLIEAMVAVGRAGETSQLPENLQEREKPNSRKSVEEFAFENIISEKARV